MSILGKIFGRIFPGAHAQPQAAPGAGPAAAAQPGQPAQPASPRAQAPTATAGTPAAGGTATATAERVDVTAVLDGLAGKNAQKLNWRTSIVDLMKLVGMDSTLQERRELADELGYHGDKNDTAAMNTWLHKEVMKKLQENGGKVPANLLD